jgi:signal transduction histidine kinase
VSERKQLETALRERAGELLAADKTKDDFLATLAHELHNALAPMRHAVQVQSLLGEKTGPVHEAGQIIENQLRHICRLLEDVLDVSRVAQGKLELRKQTLDLVGLMRSVAELLQPRIEQRGQRLALELPAEPVAIVADPVRLEQIFGNLLSNATKYTPAGGHIWFSATRESGGSTGGAGCEVCVRVRDTGVGLAAEDLHRIFELFVQLDDSSERSPSGLGIGLPLVKQLVLLHGGTVEAHSAGRGRGCEFVVRLPVREPILPGLR